MAPPDRGEGSRRKHLLRTIRKRKGLALAKRRGAARADNDIPLRARKGAKGDAT